MKMLLIASMKILHYVNYAENDKFIKIEKEYVCSLKEANLYLNNDKAITVNRSPSMNIPEV